MLLVHIYTMGGRKWVGDCQKKVFTNNNGGDPIKVRNIIDFVLVIEGFHKKCGPLLDWALDQLPSVAIGSSITCLGHNYSKQGKTFSNVIQVMPSDLNFEYLFVLQTFIQESQKACIKKGLDDGYGDEMISSISNTFL